MAAGFLAAGFLADLAAGLGAGAFFGVALGLATVCGGVARERRSIGRASEDEGTASTPSSGRRHGDAVASMALRGRCRRAFFLAGAFLAAGFLAGFLALFLAGAGSSSGAAPLNGLILLKKLPMASMVAQSGFAGAGGYVNARLSLRAATGERALRAHVMRVVEATACDA